MKPTSATKTAKGTSMLWGSSIEFWDLWGVRLLFIGAFVGVGGLVLSALSAYVLYRVADVAQKDLVAETSRAATELTRAQADIEKSKAEIAQANERAAQATQKATEAALELERFKAPRVLAVEQQKRIAEKIRSFAGVKFDSAVLVGDPEALSLLEMIEAAVKAADWVQIDWHDTIPRTLLVTRQGFGPTVGNASIAGVVVQFETEEKSALGRSAESLAAALNAEGIPAVASENFVQNTAANTTAIHIMVGKKF